MEPTNKFSIRRFVMAARFYLPVLYRQIIIYAVFSLLTGLLFIPACKERSIIFLIPFLALVFSTMICLGPLAFSSRGSLVTETSLPATATEKSAFLLLYCFIVLPLILLLPYSIIISANTGNILAANPNIPVILKLVHTWGRISMPSHILYIILATAVCLFGISAFNRRRTILSLLMASGVFIIIGISNLFHFMAILAGLHEKGIIGNVAYSIDSDIQLLEDMTRLISTNRDLFGSTSSYGIGELAVIAITISILLPAIFHKIKNRQI